MKIPEFKPKITSSPEEEAEKQKGARQKLAKDLGLRKNTTEKKLIDEIEKSILPTDEEFNQVIEAVQNNEARKSTMAGAEKNMKSFDQIKKENEGLDNL